MYPFSTEAKKKWMGLDCKWNHWGSADLQLYSHRHGAGFCWLLGHWAAVSAIMRSICLCFLPAVTLTASVDCCCTPPPPPPKPKVPDTQQLNKNTQISHVDHGKNFQLHSPGQLDLAKLTCALLLLCRKSVHHKLCFSKDWSSAWANLPLCHFLYIIDDVDGSTQNLDTNVIFSSCHYSKNLFAMSGIRMTSSYLSWFGCL